VVDCYILHISCIILRDGYRGYKNLLRDTETYLGRPSGIGTPYLFQFDRDKKVILDGDLPK